MRLIFPLFFIFMFIIVSQSWLNMVVGADPKVEAVKFVESVRGGSLYKTVKHFGSNVCRCPHKGGWGSYLVYNSGQEPNLAFITGHPFNLGRPEMFRLSNNVQAILPWQKPEDTAIDVPLRFNQYRPLFLPLKMAYGQKMTESEFNEFLSDPDKDAWKGLTLRFRTSLKPGAIAPPTEPIPQDEKQEFNTIANNVMETRDKSEGEADSTEDEVKRTLGADKTQWFQPKDAGSVIDDSGNAIPMDKIAAQLPRLEQAVLRLHVVRRGSINDWTIYHFGVMYPVLVYPDGHEVKLEHFIRPSSGAEVQRSVDETRQQLGGEPAAQDGDKQPSGAEQSKPSEPSLPQRN